MGTNSMRTSIFRAGLLGLVLLAAACGDDEGSGPNTGAVHVALFINDTYVDWDTSDYGSEASNLYDAFRARGFQVDTFSATDSAAVAAILAANDVVVFPENEGNGYSGIAAGTWLAVKAWADTGGTVAAFADFTYLNTAFGWTLDGGDSWDDGAPYERTDAADETPFDGPETIPGHSATSTIDAASLPGNAIIVYTGYDGSPDAGLAILPAGTGRMVYFGWDYYDGVPTGVHDGGWYKLLDGLAGF
jgi:hypothetical protein